MSDVDVRLPQHGRDHRIGGSDPIPGLEASDGDYVFIEKITIASHGDEFDFTDIPQTFDHLVLEATVAGYSNYGILLVGWNGYVVTDYVTVLVETGMDGSHTPIAPATFTEYNINAGVRPTGSASLPEGGDGFAHLTMKWPFYKLNTPRVVFQGGGESLGDGNRFWQTTGQGYYRGDGAVDEITLVSPASGGFEAGSVASLYGIR